MLVSDSWCEETAEDIIYEFEELLCNHQIKIDNENPEENEYKTEDSYINLKEYKELRSKVEKELRDFADYIEYQIERSA